MRYLFLLGIICSSLACSSMPGEKPSADLFAPNSRILFQGDSITDGNRGRTTDPNHILGHGYVFVIAAKYGSDFPSDHLDFMNRGVSGNTVASLTQRWQKDTLDLKPDVLSILIGVNDTDRFMRSGSPTPEEFEKGYDELLTQTVAALPNVKLVLCEPFILPVGRLKDNWDARHAAIVQRQAVVTKLAEKHHAVLVKLQQAFNDACKLAPADYWMWDGIHPTYSGHQIFADAWVAAVRKTWNKP